MTLVNQNNDPIEEEVLFGWVGDCSTLVTDQERNDAIALLCQHLNVTVVRTNATKNGGTELVLQERS